MTTSYYDKARALADSLGDAIDLLEECYDELKRHQSQRIAHEFLSDVNRLRSSLRQNAPERE